MKTRNVKLPAFLTIVILIALLSSSCSYYRVMPVNKYSSLSISNLEPSGKYLVLKRGDEAWHMYDVQLTNDSILAKLDVHLGYNINHLYPKTNGINRFSRKAEPEVEYTVHLYTNDSSFNTFDSVITIHESSIYKIDKFAYAQAPSRASIIVPIVLAPVAVIVLIGVGTASAMNNWSVSGNTSWSIK